MSSLSSYKSWNLSLVTKAKLLFPLILIIYHLQVISCTRVKLYSEGEPIESDIYEEYRTFYADKSYYYLKSAGLIRKSDINSKNLNIFKGSKDNFNFNSNDFLQRIQKVTWLLPGTERVSLHVYDDPKEMNLASGPQVNQQVCGLLLDYMNHMADKYYQNVVNSSELSIFSIMQSFGAPNSGLTGGSTVFPGNYQSCVETKLNVIKRELDRINRRESELLFEKKNKTLSKFNADNSDISNSEHFLESIKNYFLHLFNLYEGDETNYAIIEQYQDKIKVMPTRYCMAALRWPSWQNDTFSRRTLALRIGTCLPDVCDSNSIKFYHNKIKRLTEKQIPEYYQGFYISTLYCLPDKGSPLRNPFNYTSTRLFFASVIIWVLLILISTALRPIIEHLDAFKSWWHFLSCWCLTRNLSNFLQSNRNSQYKNAREVEEQEKESGNSIDLKPLDGFKVFSSFAVVTSHVLILASGVSWNSVAGHRLMSKSLLASISSIGPSSVDNFFVVTGFISAYSLLKKSHNNLMKPLFWIQFFVYRYIRVVPLYLVVHWAIQSIGRFAGSGPFWDYGTSLTAWGKRCEMDSLWGVLFPMANFKSPTDQCNPVGWYLANDIQFSLLTPFIIVMYLKNSFIGNLTVLISTFVAMINHVRYYYYDQPESRSGLEFSMLTIAQITVEGSAGYTNPQYRCLSYFIGLAAGNLLYEYEKGIINKWPTYFTSFCKTLVYFTIAIISLIPYVTLLLPKENLPLMHFLGSIFAGTIHGLTSFGSAALLILVSTGHFKALSQLLSLNIFESLSKASLCTALIHSPVIFYHINSCYSLPELSLYYILSMNTTWIIESMIFSVALHVLVELPMRKFLIKALIKMLSRREDKTNKIKGKYVNANENGFTKQTADNSLKEKLN